MGGSVGVVEESGWFGHVSAVAVIAVTVFSFWANRSGEAHHHEPAATDPADDAGPVTEHTKLSVAAMTCKHCAQGVRRALEACSGVRSANVDLPRGLITVVGDDLAADRLVAAVAGSGYVAKTIAADRDDEPILDTTKNGPSACAICAERG